MNKAIEDYRDILISIDKTKKEIERIKDAKNQADAALVRNYEILGQLDDLQHSHRATLDEYLLSASHQGGNITPMPSKPGVPEMTQAMLRM